MRYLRTAVSTPLPSRCMRAGVASNVPGESEPRSRTSCSGGDVCGGR